MNTKTITIGSLSNLFFELGLALKLNKIPIDEAIKCMNVDKVKTLVEKAEQNNKTTWNWEGTYITPGERLKAVLELNEISQVELAKKLNVNRQKINDLISGRLNITIKLAKKIGIALDTNYKIFL